MDSFGIRILRKDLLPYVLAKKPQNPKKPTKSIQNEYSVSVTAILSEYS